MAVQFNGLIEWQPGWLSSLLVWLSNSQDSWFSEWVELFEIRKWKYKLPRGHLQGTFPKSSIHEINQVARWNQKIFFQESWFFIDVYWSKSLFCWKSKWSVWPIGIFSTIAILKFRMEKGSYGGKVKFQRGRKNEISRLRSKNRLLRGFPRPKWLLKYSGIFPDPSGLILYHVCIILEENWWKSMKIKKNQILIQNPSLLSPLGGLLVWLDPAGGQLRL